MQSMRVGYGGWSGASSKIEQDMPRSMSFNEHDDQHDPNLHRDHDHTHDHETKTKLTRITMITQ